MTSLGYLKTRTYDMISDVRMYVVLERRMYHNIRTYG